MQAKNRDTETWEREKSREYRGGENVYDYLAMLLVLQGRQYLGHTDSIVCGRAQTFSIMQ